MSRYGYVDSNLLVRKNGNVNVKVLNPDTDQYETMSFAGKLVDDFFTTDYQYHVILYWHKNYYDVAWDTLPGYIFKDWHSICCIPEMELKMYDKRND